jgi:hypothetical protein
MISQVRPDDKDDVTHHERGCRQRGTQSWMTAISSGMMFSGKKAKMRNHLRMIATR